MTPDSMDSYRQLVSQLQAMEKEIGDNKAALARIEGQLAVLANQRSEQRSEHSQCRVEVNHELDMIDRKYVSLSEDLARLTSWGRALAISGTIIVTILTVVNILLAVGIRI